MKNATPALMTLDRAGVIYTVHEYQHDPSVTSYGREAATLLQVAPERVFKTLMVQCAVDSRTLAVAVIPVSVRLNLKAMARAMGVKKCHLAPVAVAERSSGYVIGGISPIGQKRNLPTHIDSSAQNFSTIYVSGGQRGLDVELSANDLANLANGVFSEVSELETSLNHSDRFR